jgi:hypothetical protein
MIETGIPMARDLASGAAKYANAATNRNPLGTRSFATISA